MYVYMSKFATVQQGNNPDNQRKVLVPNHI